MLSLFLLSAALAPFAQAAARDANHFLVLFEDKKTPDEACRLEGTGPLCGFEDKCELDGYVLRHLLRGAVPRYWHLHNMRYQWMLDALHDFNTEIHNGTETFWSNAFAFRVDHGAWCHYGGYKGLCCTPLNGTEVNVPIINAFQVREQRKVVRRVPVPQFAKDWLKANTGSDMAAFYYKPKDWDSRYPKDLTTIRFDDSI